MMLLLFLLPWGGWFASTDALNQPAEKSAPEKISLGEDRSIHTPEADLEDLRHDYNQDNNFRLTGRIQTRLLFLGNQQHPIDRTLSNAELRKLPAEAKPAGDLRFRRLRLGFSGEVNHRWFYALDIRVENLINTNQLTPNENGGVTFSYIGYRIRESINYTIGSFNLPFGREWLTSSARLVSLERSVAANQIANNFDAGMMLDGRILQRKLYYAAGLFSGAGGTLFGRNAHPTRSPMGAARIQWDPLGEYRNGFDIFSSHPMLSFGSAILYQRKSHYMARPFLEGGEDNLTSVTIDSAFVWGLTTAEGAVFYSRTERYEAQGWYLMPSVFLQRESLQVWLKYESWFNSRERTMTTDLGFNIVPLTANLSLTRYIGMGLNIYHGYQHNLKIQAGYYLGLNRALGNNGRYRDAGIADDWGAVQLQVTF